MHEHFRDFAKSSTGLRRDRVFRTGWTLLAGCPTPAGVPDGTALLIDLRADDEAAALPVVAGDAILKQIPIDVTKVERWLGTRPTNREYAALQEETLERCGARIAEVVSAVAESPGAVVYGCSMGKDRTGLLAGLMAAAVGVPEEDVLAEDDRARHRLLDCAPAVSRYSVVRSVPADEFTRRCLLDAGALRSAFEHIRRNYGSVPEYLRANGVDAATMDRLRTVLVNGSVS